MTFILASLLKSGTQQGAVKARLDLFKNENGGGGRGNLKSAKFRKHYKGNLHNSKDWVSHINPKVGFPDSSVGKKSTCNAGDPGSIPGSGRSTGEGIGHLLQYSWASLVAQLVKNLPAMRETWVQSLDWEDPLEKRKATHSGIPA